MSFPHGWETPAIVTLPTLPSPVIGVDFSKVSNYPDLEVSIYMVTGLGSSYTSSTTTQTLKNQGKLQFFTATQPDVCKLLSEIAAYGSPNDTSPIISFQTSNPSHKVWSYEDTGTSCTESYHDQFDASTKSAWGEAFFSPIFVVDNATSKVVYAVMPVGVYETVNSRAIPVIQLHPCPEGTCKGPYGTCDMPESHSLPSSTSVHSSPTLVAPHTFVTHPRHLNRHSSANVPFHERVRHHK